MLRQKRRVGALVALAVVSALFVPGSARAAETFNIIVAQDFFNAGVPAFSARVYPGSVRVHTGDTLVFTNGGIALGPAGQYPQEFLGENWAKIDQDWFYFMSDPDDGERALKFNEKVFAAGDCGTVDNPCEWTGAEADLVVPGEPAEDGLFYVNVAALPGTTLWGASAPFADIGVNFKVEVVGPQDAASTQAELDQRANQLMRKDYEDVLALHARMNAKRTSHTTASGQKVYDVFVGAVGGPIEIFASYPRKISVPEGARVQYHFAGEMELHTATFGGPNAQEEFNTGIFPFCDPDGDEGTAADTEVTEFTEQGDPVCPEGSTVEFDVSNRTAFETGDGRVMRSSDYENSGIKQPLYPDGSDFESTPWTVRFPNASNDKGFKYICLVHGGFMGGRVVVK
ncbi:MAG TPA: hypothetical protein VJ927_02435 [Actinomycetota bacterium]|nr:hypothetical protein [Actinomycetota bacterium]